MIYWRSEGQLFSAATLDFFEKKLIPCLQEIYLNKAKEYELLGINLLLEKKLSASCQKSIGKQFK